MKIKYYKWEDELDEYTLIYKRVNDKMYYYDDQINKWVNSWYSSYTDAYTDMVLDCGGTLKEISEKQAFIEML